MIISHRYKFIYIKTRKTGGTSVEKALADICGDEDIITKDHLHDGEFDSLSQTSRNYRGYWLPLRELMACSSFIDRARVGRDWVTRPKFFNHMRAISVKSRIKKSIWQNYYKFTFERNPWDKCVSYYFWHGRLNNNLVDFNEFVTKLRGGKTLDQALPIDWPRYTRKNKIIVDDVFDYDELESNLNIALKNSEYDSTNKPISLPHLKGGLRRNEIAYSDKSRLVVKKYFAREIEQFGYRCPQKYS